jgi:hypothetical protein
LEKGIGIAIEIDSNTVKQAIMRMKKLLEMITILFNKIINGEKVPEEWKVPILTSIHKKGDKSKCDNYREISVTSKFSRIYGQILAQLLELEYKNMEMEEQSGFRAGRLCIDNIFYMTQIIEKKKATNRVLHLLFIDLTKAYNSVPLNKLWETMDITTINTKVIEVLGSLYEVSSSKIKVGNLITKGFKVTKGLRHALQFIANLI